MLKCKLFDRGLDQNFLQEVEIFLETSVGRRIKKDNTFDLCIRKNYINVYCDGCSILKYEPKFKKNGKFKIHKKYLRECCENDEKYENLEMIDGDLISKNFSFINDVMIKRNKYLRRYADVGEIEKNGEKKHVSAFLKNSVSRPFLLDLEIAYSREKRDGAIRKNAPRIDMACIDYTKNKLMFIEVKLDTDPRVRLSKAARSIDNKGEAGIEVFRQIDEYCDFLTKQSVNILSSYKRIAKNYIDLGLVHKLSSFEDKEAIKIISSFIDSGTIDNDPYLLLVGTGHNDIGPYGSNINVLKNSFYDVIEISFCKNAHMFHRIKAETKDKYMKN